MKGDDTILAMYEAAERFHGVIRQQLANEFDEIIGAALLAAVEAVRAGVEIRDPRLYMHGIIRHTMIRAAVRRRKETEIAPNMAADVADPLEQLIEEERRETGLHLVATAAPRDREILLRSFYLEEDQQTVEAAMRLDDTAYRNLKHRAKSRLQRAANQLAA